MVLYKNHWWIMGNNKDNKRKESKLGENITVVYVAFWLISAFFIIPAINVFIYLKPGGAFIPNLIIAVSCIILSIASFIVPFLAKKWKRQNITVIEDGVSEKEMFEKSKEAVRRSTLMLNHKVDDNNK